MQLPNFKKENKHNNPYLTKLKIFLLSSLKCLTQAPIALGAEISHNHHAMETQTSFAFPLKCNEIHAHTLRSQGLDQGL